MAVRAITQETTTWKHAFARCGSWLRDGFVDFKQRPVIGLTYGGGFLSMSYLAIACLYFLDLSWMLLPALAGAMLIGPLPAIGLYQEARRIKFGCHCAVASPGQLMVAGAILMVLLLTWIRSATILYALFFGLKPFPGLAETMRTLLLSVDGVALIITGTLVGGLFAALTLAVSFFSIPMLADREVDAFTAMGRSFSACTHNFKLATAWGACVTVIVVAGVMTGLLALIVLFPLAGFATWRAYDDLFGAAGRCEQA